ncbi:Bax inhibitor-1/YccA family protein [Rhodospirillaceae bacterium SYSU D60014]|uniref:Bax inhibitor-1/YccA family protein n=1 Tax=Virgifigura deserti TaxID=2268457 RepID=UPI000E66BBC5
MAIGPDRKYMTRGQADVAQIDVGLRQYMLGVYNYMGGGLALTGIIAYLTASSETMMQAIFGTGLAWLVILAPLGIVFFLNFRIHKMSFATAQMSFWAYAALNGLAFSFIFMLYTETSIARVFFITGATFAAMSLYGYTTKRDLTGWGSFLFMGLIGIIIAMVVNMFLASSALQFAISVIGVLVFTGLTAYDTQKIKENYYEGDDGQIMGKKTIMGALSLYLDFINLFLMMLRLFGNRE